MGAGEGMEFVVPKILVTLPAVTHLRNSVDHSEHGDTVSRLLKGMRRRKLDVSIWCLKPDPCA
jgi:hypothetical protein